MAYGKIIPFVVATADDATAKAVERVNAEAAPARLSLETQLMRLRDEIKRIDGVIMEMDALLQRMHADATQRAHDRLRRQVKIDQIREQRSQNREKTGNASLETGPER